MSIKLHALYKHRVVSSVEVEIGQRRFPGGETYLKVPVDVDTPDMFSISCLFEGNDDLFNLALLVDAVRREYGGVRISLWLPYLPYARQDRMCSPGESLSVKVACDFINSLKFDSVGCKDIHSPVGSALLDNLNHYELRDIFGQLTSVFDTSTTVLVSPDAGANKKVLEVAKLYSFPNVARADKSRDVLTGKITGTVVYSEHVGTKDFLIVDDICDGGRTFIELAKELRKLTDGKIYLYVTHGIFSAGMEVFDGLIDGVYVSNLMNKSHPLITVV